MRLEEQLANEQRAFEKTKQTLVAPRARAPAPHDPAHAAKPRAVARRGPATGAAAVSRRETTPSRSRSTARSPPSLPHPRAPRSAQEFEMMRIRLVEQLEVPYQNRFQKLQQELQLSREQFFEHRREAALMREELSQARAAHAQEMDDTVHEYDRTLADARERLRQMQAQAEDTTFQDRNRALQIENAELKAQAKSLREELDDVRKQKENAVVERERAVATHARELSDEIVAAKIMQSEKESLARLVVPARPRPTPCARPTGVPQSICVVNLAARGGAC